MNRNFLFLKSLSLHFNSNFHSSCCYQAAPRQAGNFMKKVMGAIKKKKPYFKEAAPNITDAFSKPSTGHISTNPRRVTVLNKLFMRNITDLMSTEVYSSQLLGLGVEINKVKINTDYKILKVYWTSAIIHQEKAEEILLKNAGLLRHALSQLRLMGNVPIIQFVKDKHYDKIHELNKRLAIADYGEDGPSNTDPVAHLISEFQLSMPIEDELKEQLVKLEEQNPYEVKELQLPAMTHCVFNLDHEDIMNRVKKNNRKTRNADSSSRSVDENWASFKLNQYLNTDPVVLGNAKLQREAFNKFLQQRNIMQKKLKESRYADTDTDFIQEDIKFDNRYLEPKDIDDDYIIEDMEDKGTR
ncbi:uncharacterized protein [Diabrotica undecimpunctata]|uniref:uncharacterized protein n=1 Tax=Diabrotica undecimpunctata TaxID=50387 RepID=UPI003B6399B2